MKERQLQKIIKELKKAVKHTKKVDKKDKFKKWWTAKKIVAIVFASLLLMTGIYGVFTHDFHPFNRVLEVETTTVNALGTGHHIGKSKIRPITRRRNGNGQCQCPRGRTPDRQKQE